MRELKSGEMADEQLWTAEQIRLHSRDWCLSGDDAGTLKEIGATEVVKEAIARSLAVLEDKFIRTDGSTAPTETDGGNNQADRYHPCYQMKNPYTHCPLPFIIGSKEFRQQLEVCKPVNKEDQGSIAPATERSTLLDVSQSSTGVTLVDNTDKDELSSNVVHRSSNKEASASDYSEPPTESPLFNNKPLGADQKEERAEPLSGDLFHGYDQKVPTPPSFPATVSPVRSKQGEEGTPKKSDSQPVLSRDFRNELDKVLTSKSLRLDGTVQQPLTSKTSDEDVVAQSSKPCLDSEEADVQYEDDLFLWRPPPLVPSRPGASRKMQQQENAAFRNSPERKPTSFLNPAVSSSETCTTTPIGKNIPSQSAHLFSKQVIDNSIPPVPFVPPVVVENSKKQLLPRHLDSVDKIDVAVRTSSLKPFQLHQQQVATFPSASEVSPKPRDEECAALVKERQTLVPVVVDDDDEGIFAGTSNKTAMKAEKKAKTRDTEVRQQVDASLPVVADSLFDSDDDDILFGDLLKHDALERSSTKLMPTSGEDTLLETNEKNQVYNDLFSVMRVELNQKLSFKSGERLQTAEENNIVPVAEVRSSRAKIPSATRKLPSRKLPLSISSNSPVLDSGGSSAHKFFSEDIGILPQPSTPSKNDAQDFVVEKAVVSKVSEPSLRSDKSQGNERSIEPVFAESDEEELFVTKKTSDQLKPSEIKVSHSSSQGKPPSTPKRIETITGKPSIGSTLQNTLVSKISTGLFDEDDESYLELFK
ncbi:unnamed protein product [Soboliphyme baturini]|uniref:BRCT domain-containing protein n=1 Tax=Soboliphyme baturini TaxID=241478 RepID=A0A183ICP5_9BILA|nr:unnamed protein product [Soboliphyme baturini]